MEGKKEKVEKAVSLFEKGFNCSQALLSTYGEEFGLDRELALKISAPFGCGIGCMGETCGALTGAFMVMGLKFGKTGADDEQKAHKTYSLVREIAEKFESKNGSIVCRDLLGCDLSTPEGMRQANRKLLFSRRCPNLVRDAAEIIEEMLE